MIGNHDTPDDAAVKLHEAAMSAEKSLEQLATGLGQMGAEPDAVKALGQMADAVRKIAQGLAAPAAPEPRPTIDSATDDMMADHHAARQAAAGQ